MTAGPDSRLVALEAWLAGIETVRGGRPVPASEDASFRRYFRLVCGGKSYVVMDAPPPAEDCRPFVRVAGDLAAMGLNAPRVIASDVEQGFLLLTDLGTSEYLNVLRQSPDRVDALYADALDALATMHARGTSMQHQLPAYDEDLLRFELSLFHDWLCGKHLGITLTRAEARHWQALCDELVANALAQPRVYVHRDYHSRNLMLTEIDNPGILDFQDAVEGPLTYDLVSLLKDCYLRWPDERVAAWMRGFYDRMQPAMQKRVAADEFVRYFELMGVQRHLKAAGIFARLSHRDGKDAYLDDVPRTLSYIVRLADRHPSLCHRSLGFLIELIVTRILPGLEADAT